MNPANAEAAGPPVACLVRTRDVAASKNYVPASLFGGRGQLIIDGTMRSTDQDLGWRTISDYMQPTRICLISDVSSGVINKIIRDPIRLPRQAMRIAYCQ